MPITTFRARRISEIGSQWRAVFDDYWPSYEAWYRQHKQADINPQALKLGQRQLGSIMPEMMPLYQSMREVTNDCPVAAQFLTGYQPPAYLLNCSQAVLLDEEPLLMRNYDLSPDLSENLITQSDWLGQGIIGTNECLWGLDDGINKSGLCASVTFGGSNQVGRGFGIPFIMRYLLLTCETVKSGIGLLQRVPSHMAYNISLVDRQGSFATVMLAPGQAAIVTRERCITNHQARVSWPQQAAFSRTRERKRFLDELLARDGLNERQLLAAFLAAPLFNSDYRRNFGTVYTAVYRPLRESMSYHWSGEQAWRHGFTDFRAQQRTVNLGKQASIVDVQSDVAKPTDLDYGLSAALRQQLLQSLEYLPASVVAQPEALDRLKWTLKAQSHFSWQDYARQIAQVWQVPVPVYPS